MSGFRQMKFRKMCFPQNHPQDLGVLPPGGKMFSSLSAVKDPAHLLHMPSGAPIELMIDII